ncbi:MAG: hypothetical protein DHS20C12_17970 [Pseudohongiella sp.]|nr:MAG: hypothetical protein DHS20C12_17970 [Pseudohongiella sp.]
MIKLRIAQLHRQIGWGAATALLIWGVSSLMHPTMTWFGPQAMHSFPPSMVLQGQALQNLSPLLEGVANLGESRVVKLVPGEDGALLQLTLDQSSPRQYYDVSSQLPLAAHDLEQAKWLASYYTGIDRTSIEGVEFMTSFSDEYPEINRLLPVYRVQFSTESSLVAFVHTGTGALASLSNPFKDRVQWLFQHLHTFKWLDGLEYGRVLLIAFFVLSLLATSVIGLMLVLSFKPRAIPDKKRRYHRRIAYVAWLPLLAWSASGFYHLMQSSLIENEFGIRLDGPFNSLGATDFRSDSLDGLVGRSLNNLALIRSAEGRLYWRASVARERSEEATTREERFAGNPSEFVALYLPASSSGEPAQLDDAQLAESLALRFANADAQAVANVSQVTHFGADYDFRNKRLPVWKVDLDDASGTTLFVDTATGVLVDRNKRSHRAEAWVFAILHKWNHLNGFTGAMLRDVLIVATIFMLLTLGVFGIGLLGKRRRAVPRHA